ncbi:hypothetical protein [Novosphingobium sp.]|jgi:hypothetical protein|uniref:hypothetical protein n=1 Tax=Novosphingobium sp. TaxID=1874826 RepID=UPI002FDFD73B
MKKALSYLVMRLNERSTWMMIGTGVASSALLPDPYPWVSMIILTIAAIVPDGVVVKESAGE